MRGFKYISMAAVLLWLIAITTPLSPVVDKSLDDEVFFQHQLVNLDKTADQNRLIIYGSSGLLMGLSAESFKLVTGHETRNLSTSGLGGQIEKAVSLINAHAKSGDIILVGDRLYRDSDILSGGWHGYWKKFFTRFSLAPDLAQYVYSFTPFVRTNAGDLAVYPTIAFAPSKYDSYPAYTSANIDIMLRQATLIKQSGHCPVLVLVPLLVKKDEQAVFNKATSQLFALADAAGLSANLVHVPAIETDRSLFLNQTHMSAKGRDKWTGAIAHEMMERNMCNLTSAPQPNEKLKS